MKGDDNMFLLSTGILGASSCSNVAPLKQAHSSVSFYGGVSLDGVHAKGAEIPDNTILSINSEELFFDIDTIFLANFENTLEAGSIMNNDTMITHWAIRRKESTDALNPLLATIPYDNIVSYYTDTMPKSKTEYVYSVAPISGTGNNRVEGRGIEGVGIVDFYGWTLSSISATPITYNFNLEINSEAIEAIKDFKVYQNYTQFPAVRFGNASYKKGKLSTIPYIYNDSDNSYTIDVALLEDVVDFINDGNEKVLRNPIGQIFKVITHNASYQFFDKIPEQPYTLSFEFTQTGVV